MVGPTTNPLGFTVDPLLVIISCMCLQDEEGWVDAELFRRQVADLQVLRNCDRVKRICALKQPGELAQTLSPHLAISP